MHGREGEERKRRPHMWPVPAPGTALSASSAAHPPPPPTLAQPDNASSESDSPLSSRDSFLKVPSFYGFHPSFVWCIRENFGLRLIKRI